MTSRPSPLLVALSLVVACGGGSDTPPDAGDAGPGDAGPRDAGPADTGPADTGPADTGRRDTGPGPCDDPDDDDDGVDDVACGGTDCDDEAPSVFPGATDTVGDAVDQDCDGVDGVDADSDGQASEASGGADCDDDDPEVYDGAPDSTWAMVDVADFGSSTAGRFPSAVIDGSGVTHVAFRNGSGNLIRYGTDASGTFTDVEVTDTGESGNQQTSLALAPGGAVVIAFDGAGDLVNVATRQGDGSFVVESIPGTIYDSGPRAVAVDSAGAVHVVFHQTLGGASDLGYATDASGSWVVTTPDTAGDTGRDPSVVVDGDDTVHVFYEDITNGRLMHAWDDGGGFATEVVDESDTNGRYSSPFVVGSSLHLAYRSGSAQALRYATNASGSWVTSTVDDGGNTGFHPSLVVDGSGAIHVAYYRLASLTDSRLRYAVGAPGAWSSEEVDARFIGGAGHIAMDVDGDGAPHLYYPTGGAGSVLTHTFPDGVDQDCDGVDG